MRHIQLADDLMRFLAAGESPEPLGISPLDGPAEPSDRDLVRLGRGLGLDLIQAVVLVLKGQWERFRVEHVTRDDAQGHPGGAQLHLHREFHAGACGRGDASALFHLFEEEAGLATVGGYDEDSFQALVQHCILLHLQVHSFHGPEVQAFAASQRVERGLLAAATPEERAAYGCMHRLWRALEDEIGSLLLEVEGQSLENRRIERQWMETFGSEYLPLLEAEARFRSLEGAIAHKTRDPHLSLQELEALEAEDLRHAEQEMARLRRTVALSRIARLSGPGGMPLDARESLGYEDECRRLLREIYRLTHPDVLGRHQFTELQIERLIGYYREAVACASATEFDDVEIALGMRSLASLEGVLAQVRKIWEVEGLDVNEGAALRGATLAERRGWLEARIMELEQHARHVRADLLALATDADVREKRACLRSRAQVAAITGEMEQKRRWYEARVPTLEARLDELFGSASDPKPT